MQIAGRHLLAGAGLAAQQHRNVRSRRIGQFSHHRRERGAQAHEIGISRTRLLRDTPDALCHEQHLPVAMQRLGAQAHLVGMSGMVKMHMDHLGWPTGRKNRSMRTIFAVVMAGLVRTVRYRVALPPHHRRDLAAIGGRIGLVGSDDRVLTVDQDQRIFVQIDPCLRFDLPKRLCFHVHPPLRNGPLGGLSDRLTRTRVMPHHDTDT